jgi:hypothetical protein
VNLLSANKHLRRVPLPGFVFLLYTSFGCGAYYMARFTGRVTETQTGPYSVVTCEFWSRSDAENAGPFYTHRFPAIHIWHTKKLDPRDNDYAIILENTSMLMDAKHPWHPKKK